MTRRQTPVLRNLDDPLRVLNVLSLRSCALVLVVYTVLAGLDAVLGLFSLLLGTWAFLVPFTAAGAVALGLALAERTDDEHLVPSAIRFYLQDRRADFYSGAAPAPILGPDGVWHGRP